MFLKKEHIGGKIMCKALKWTLCFKPELIEINKYSVLQKTMCLFVSGNQWVKHSKLECKASSNTQYILYNLQK